MTQAKNPDQTEASAIDGLLAEAASSAGYQVSSLEPLRAGNNYIFVDRQNSLIYRVPAFPRQHDDLADENKRLIQLADVGAPILPPLQTEPLVLAGGQFATVWTLGEAPDRDPASSLAPLLASLHDVEPVAGLEVWAGFERGHRRIEKARSGQVPDSLVDEIADRIHALQTAFPEWPKTTVVHGDPHTGNLVKTSNGHLLIDLDDVGLGCPEIDLATMGTSCSRFEGVPGTWEAFKESYGRHFDGDLLNSFMQLRQLTMIAWLLSLWDIRPESHAEAAYRVSTLDKAAVWNPL